MRGLSGEAEAGGGKGGGEGRAGEIVAFALTRAVDRVDPLQRVIDLAGMDHDHRAIGQAVQEAGKERREVAAIEIIGA